LISDDFPAFIIPRHNAVIADRIAIPFFVVDSKGVVPLNEMSKCEYAARTIRPKIQRLLPVYLKDG
jgi:deoxyribodipyrimidine photo-lyase